MDKIEKLNFSNIKERPIGKSASAAFICRVAEKIVGDIFEPEISKEIKAVSFRDGVLTFSAPNSTLFEEIILKGKEISNRINGTFQNKEVKKIKFKPSSSEKFY